MDIKMDRQALYEIYRACRLCGGGAGYKMPIVQDIIVMDDVDVDLRQKIKECVRIEANLNDRMPPLICELCIDKINSYYDFLQLCKRTNENTRRKLGLPLQTTSKDKVETESILGVVEPVLTNNTDGESSAKNKKIKKIRTENKEPEIKIKIEKDTSTEKPKPNLKNPSSKNTRTFKIAASSQKEKTPPRSTRKSALDTDDVALSKLIVKSDTRITRRTASDANDDQALSKLAEHSKKAKPDTKPIVTNENDSKKEELARGLKRFSRELQMLFDTPPVKKKKTTNIQTPTSSTKILSRPTPKNSPKPTNPTQKSTSNIKEKPPQTPKESKTLKHTKTPQKKPIPPTKQIKHKEINTPKQTNSPSKTKAQKEANTPQMKIPPQNDTNTPQIKTEQPNICVVCDITFRFAKDRSNHMRRHTVLYTSKSKACNACREWFADLSEAQSHHMRHRCEGIPYRCMLCSKDFETYDKYHEHINRNECRTSTEVPDVKCEKCWKYFPTKPLLKGHHCWGEGDRPAMCIICKETVAARHLKKHEKDCKPKKVVLDSAQVEQDVLDRLLPMNVRVARCDPLLRVMEHGHIDVSSAMDPFGLDKRYHYPYIRIKPRTKVKAEPITTNHMVTINDDIKEEFDYTHWDSDDSDENIDSNDDAKKNKNVPHLSSLCLKVLYSPKVLGKVRKRRRIKTEVKSDFGVIINSVLDNETNKMVKVDSRRVDSPRLGSVAHYSSHLNDVEENNSSSTLEESFTGFETNIETFDMIDKMSNNSNDSQSIISNTVKNFLKNTEETDTKVIHENEPPKDTLTNNINIIKDNAEITKGTNNALHNKDSMIAEADAVNKDLLNNSENVHINNDNVIEDTKLTVNSVESCKDKAETAKNGSNSKDVLEDCSTENNKPNSVENSTYCLNEITSNNVMVAKSTDTAINKLIETKIDDKEDIRVKSDKTTLNSVDKCESLKVNEQLELINEISEVKSSNNEPSDNLGLSNNNCNNPEGETLNKISEISDTNNSEDVFKLLNERISLINQSQVNNVQIDKDNNINNLLTSDVSEFTSETKKLYNKVGYDNDNIRYDNDKGNYDSVHCSNDNADDTALSVRVDCNNKNQIDTLDDVNACCNEMQSVEDSDADNFINKVDYDNDKIQYDNDKSQLDVTNYANDSVHDVNNFNNTNEIDTGDALEKDKISLGDLIKVRDAELHGMDLDSISDDEFNFD